MAMINKRTIYIRTIFDVGVGSNVSNVTQDEEIS